jgi:elongation factor G
MSIEAKTKADQENLKDTLKLLEDEDPTFKVKQDKDSGQTLITGMGELHLEVIVDRLCREFNIGVNSGIPQVSYKETINIAMEVEEEFRREHSGKVHYAKVKLRVKPLTEEESHRNIISGNFEKIIVDVSCDTENIPEEIVKGVRESAINSCGDGPLVSGKLENIHIEILSIDYRPGESNEVAFRIATAMAISKAVHNAEPNILEPIMSVSVITPEDFTGDIIGDINSKRGKVIEVNDQLLKKEIIAEIPMSELFGYASRVRSLSQGRAGYTLEFHSYEKVPINIQEQILRKIRGC